MRIISGKYRGKVIVPVKGLDARPTTDFAKESLFNILANSYDFEDLKVLDLFAGTGAISFEFASRGCTRIDAVELNHKHFEFIKKTSAEMKFEGFKVFKTDAIRYIKACSLKYTLIFADPPYDLENLSQLPDLVFEAGILENDGIFILEHPKTISFAGHKNLFDHRYYGSVNFSFFGSEKK